MYTFKLLIPLVLISLAGCVGMVTEKRHSAAEIAAYRPADFVAPIASADGERAEVAAGLEKKLVPSRD